MLTIPQIYEKFDRIGCLSFATLNENGYVDSRIAHLFAYDEDGIYLRTMDCKPFYKQMKATGRVSLCGMYPQTQVSHDEANLPYFVPGYTMRLTGDVRELSLAEVEAKAEHDRNFNVAVFDIKKYPATKIFVLYRAWGEWYDFDYEKENRDHKLERERFAFGGAEFVMPGFTITSDCTGCGACLTTCTFDAIEPGEPYRIRGNRCDECGNCKEVCPSGAILHKGC